MPGEQSPSRPGHCSPVLGLAPIAETPATVAAMVSDVSDDAVAVATAAAATAEARRATAVDRKGNRIADVIDVFRDRFRAASDDELEADDILF